MLKKVIFLLGVFCCFNVFTYCRAVEQLNKEKLSAYNKIMKQYKQQNKKITRSQVDQLLQEKNLSIQELYDNLDRKTVILGDIRAELILGSTGQMKAISSPHPGGALAGAIPLLLSMASLAIGTPLLLLGLAVKNYIAPSTIQKIASNSLMAIGGISLTPGIILEWYREGFITQVALPKIYAMITHDEKKELEEIGAINREYSTISGLAAELKKLYPELTSPQPTYQ